MSQTHQRPRILSGMRPTGKLHLGNYMGALRNWVRLQNELDENGEPKYDCYFFIADYHALTTDYADPSQLQQNTLDVALDWLAAGLDPKKSTIFVQSHVPQHAELHLLFSMITPLSWLERVPSYKDQQENLTGKDLTTYGFLGYPLLQAADILLYRPLFVPVGADQVAHVELTREVARRFNFLYPRDPEVKAAPMLGMTREEIRSRGLETEFLKMHPNASEDQGHNYRKDIGSDRLLSAKSTTFPEPDVLLTPSPKLPGTDGRKMSKSYGNTILLSEPEAELRAKLKTMVTDPARVRRSDPGNPEVCPVGDLHKVFSPQDVIAKVWEGCQTAAIGCIECKGWLADAVNAQIAPIRERRAESQKRNGYVEEVLDAGAVHATRLAADTLKTAQRACGLLARADDAELEAGAEALRSEKTS